MDHTEHKRIECPEYDALVAGVAAAKAKVAESGRAAVASLLKQFFVEYPSVTGVGWTQYTPYFNDGDPCVFRLGEFHVTTKTGIDFSEVTSIYDEADEAAFQDSYSVDDATVNEGVCRLVRSSERDLFEAAFGDHVMVIATPAGFHVSEYSHD